MAKEAQIPLLTIEGRESLVRAILFVREGWTNHLKRWNLYTEDRINEFSLGCVVDRLYETGDICLVFPVMKNQHHKPFPGLWKMQLDQLKEYLSAWEGMEPVRETRIFWRYTGCLS